MEDLSEVAEIIVGFDGCESSQAALAWAVDEGRRRGMPVRATYVMPPAMQWPAAMFPVTAGHLSDEQRVLASKDIQDRAAACGATGIEVSILEGSAVSCLCEMSRGAAMLVLGGRGHGGFPGQLIGSVALSVAVHASCPVVVVRGEDRPDRATLPILAGIDDVQNGAKVLDFALTEAALRDCTVHAIHAWRPPPQDADSAYAAERRIIEELLAPDRRVFPAIQLQARIEEGDPAHVLLEASKSAQLLVTGSRGAGGFHGLLLGSVSQQLLHHADCPVAIIR